MMLPNVWNLKIIHPHDETASGVFLAMKANVLGKCRQKLLPHIALLSHSVHSLPKSPPQGSKIKTKHKEMEI